jgi:hypothetical protein
MTAVSIQRRLDGGVLAQISNHAMLHFSMRAVRLDYLMAEGLPFLGTPFTNE